jgi:rhamnosyltransferase
MISVVIPVKNAGDDLRRCLEAIRGQGVDEEVEVVVVDSGSSDGSPEVARRYGARVTEISPHEFSHGASRNLGASQARGEVLVFLSQDAVPLDSDWLSRLTGRLREDSRLAGVYGRQLANYDAVPPEVYFLDFLYGPKPRYQRAAGVVELSMDTTLFSNVNSALWRNLWERFPFVEDIVMSEDQEWSRRLLLEGFGIAYEPRAAVRHSHRYTLGAAFRRFFDSGASSSRAYMAGEAHSRGVLRRAAARYAWGELLWLCRTGRRRWLPYAALYEATKMAGLVAGANHGRLPVSVKRFLSATPSHW